MAGKIKRKKGRTCQWKWQQFANTQSNQVYLHVFIKYTWFHVPEYCKHFEVDTTLIPVFKHCLNEPVHIFLVVAAQKDCILLTAECSLM